MKINIVILLLSFTFLSACGGGGSGGDVGDDNTVDTTAPTITLLGISPMNLSVGDTYTDPGATASDNVDGDITGNIVVAGDTVNTAAVGTYVVTYTVSDAAGNPATQVTRTVNVVDNIAPVITLLGVSPLNLSVGDIYTDPGATASDNIDGDITGNIVVAGDTVNTATVGTYVVTYNVSDAAGNPAAQLTRTVNVGDDTSPVITLLGANPLSLSVGDTYIDPGATASDNVDGDITSNIIVAGDTVNTAVEGAYVVTYDVSDSAGNPATQVTRTVNVINDPPVVNDLSISLDPAFIDSAVTFSWDISDANGDTLICALDIDNDGAEEYTINDCANNTSQLHTYTGVGDYTAKLTVNDGFNSPVVETLNFRVIAPLSTVVSVSDPAVAGEKVLYTITVGNVTTLPIDDVEVLIPIPSELQFRESSDVEPDISCGAGGSDGFCNSTLWDAWWDLGTLASGESRTIAVNALVDAATLNGVAITLPVTFSATGISNVQVDKVVEVFNSPSADLALSASTDPVVAGETFTYQLDIGNTSAGALTSTELRAFFPADVMVNSISDGGVEVNPGEVVWNEGSLGVGASLHREVTVTAGAGLIAGQILEATAQLTHDGGLAVDNTAEHALTVVANALPLEVDISISANPVVSGEKVLYTLTVSNTSQLPVDGVNVLLRTPPGLSFRESSDVEPDISCGAGGSDGVCDSTLWEAWWSLGTLVAGESRTITINAEVASVLSGNLINTPVRITATDLGDTVDLLNTVGVYNSPSADLALSASTDPVVAGETFTYQLDIGNTSAGALTSTELRAFFPADVMVNSISDGGVEVNPGEVVWNEGSLGVGASLHREVTVTAGAGLIAGQILEATAQLTHDGGLEIDNRSGFAITVTETAGIASLISVDIAATPQPVASGGVLAYTITVTNGYGLPVDNVGVLLRIPPEIWFRESSDVEPDISCGAGGSDGVCDSTLWEAWWSLGTIAAGASEIITINATVTTGIGDGNLIVTPIRVTATNMEDTINLQHTTVIDN